MPSVPWGCHRSPSPGQIYSQPYGGRTHPKSGCKWRDGSLLHPLTRCSAPALNAPGDFGVCPPLPRAPELGFSQGCVVVVIPQTQGGHAPPCPSPKPLPVPLLYFWSWDSRAAHLGPAGSGQGWPEHPPIQAPPPLQEHPRGGSPLWQRTEAPPGRPASTPISLADSDNQDTPRFPGSHRCLRPCRQSGVATRKPWGPHRAPTPCPTPCPYRPGGSAGTGRRWWHCGGYREAMPPPAGSGVGSLCNVIAAAGSAGVMHRRRAAPSRPRPILPAPCNYRHRTPGKTAGLSVALAPTEQNPRVLLRSPHGGPESRSSAPSDGDGFV